MFSLTYRGIIIAFIGFLFKAAGVPFIEGDAANFIAFGTELVGVAMVLYGRFRAGGISVWGIKKTP